MTVITGNLELPAIEVQQGRGRMLYLFAVDGKQLPSFTTVSRIRRSDEDGIEGYQRPEVLSHVRAIRRYIESENPLVPNALVIAFDGRVTFDPDSGGCSSDFSRTGRLVIPVDDALDDHEKPGWIVDGQQRTAAIREARIDSFPVSVVGFITDSDAEQRAQFILVNATKPLPKSLIYELLPATDGELPEQLQRRQLPARLLERLNFDENSELRGVIQTATTPTGIIKDNSILKSLESSITDGCLYRFRDPMTGDGDVELMLAVLKPFWQAVSLVFVEDWKKPTRKSRLMHGAGVVALSFLMDAIAERFLDTRLPSLEDFIRHLRLVKPICHWSSGAWEFGPENLRRWNDIQNTPRDTQLLTSHLLFEYRRRAAVLV